MISRVTIRKFKRFEDTTIDFPGHVVLAGPNNSGKTTVLQAIAAWSFAMNRWKERGDYRLRRDAYAKAPIPRPAFAPVSLRSFELLWKERNYKAGPLQVEIRTTEGWRVTMEFIADTPEQILVRPLRDATPEVLKTADLMTVLVPPMTGLNTEEPVYQRPKVDQVLGQGKPGDIIRNLLVEAHENDVAWRGLTESIRRIFGYEMLPPVSTGPHIVAEYRASGTGAQFDIASAGSGFQQILMLLAFLHARPASILLLDEPDAHLHVILQDVIFHELHSVAVKQKSQLIIATHSEVIINSVEPKLLCMIFDQPRMLESTEDRDRLGEALRTVSQVDIMNAQQAPGVLYLEDYTDLNILREFARILNHPAYETLTTRLFWKKTVFETHPGSPGIKARDHYDALRLVKNDLPALELVDGDANPNITDSPITGIGFQRIRWRRYEIESYLIHPAALARYVEKTVGSQAAPAHVADMEQYLNDILPPAVIREPLGNHAFLAGIKARTDLLPPILHAAGLPEVPYTEFHEIAALMLPEEIHPEVIEKLNIIQRAFRL